MIGLCERDEQRLIYNRGYLCWVLEYGIYEHAIEDGDEFYLKANEEEILVRYREQSHRLEFGSFSLRLDDSCSYPIRVDVEVFESYYE